MQRLQGAFTEEELREIIKTFNNPDTKVKVPKYLRMTSKYYRAFLKIVKVFKYDNTHITYDGVPIIIDDTLTVAFKREYGVFCGECGSSICKGCSNEHKTKPFDSAQ
jgi:hypothetical protein